MSKQESAIDIKVFYLKGMALESSSLSAACLHSCAAREGKKREIKSVPHEPAIVDSCLRLLPVHP